MDKKAKGDLGEKLAVELLESKGIEIIEQNYRYGRGEIDLIGLKDNQLLIFVEVKLRKNNQFGEPEDFVSEKQQQQIMEVAEDYIQAIHWDGNIRFDIVAVTSSRQELLHIEDAFF